MSVSILDRVEPRTILRKVAFRLSEPIAYTSFDPATKNYTKSGETDWVVVSWGRDGDTGIFPGLADGTILAFEPVRSWDFWYGHDDAMADYIGGLR